MLSWLPISERLPGLFDRYFSSEFFITTVGIFLEEITGWVEFLNLIHYDLRLEASLVLRNRVIGRFDGLN